MYASVCFEEMASAAEPSVGQGSLLLALSGPAEQMLCL